MATLRPCRRSRCTLARYAIRIGTSLPWSARDRAVVDLLLGVIEKHLVKISPNRSAAISVESGVDARMLHHRRQAVSRGFAITWLETGGLSLAISRVRIIAAARARSRPKKYDGRPRTHPDGPRILLKPLSVSRRRRSFKTALLARPLYCCASWDIVSPNCVYSAEGLASECGS